tara:strand:+ start:3298 stop:3801 length:504 start_codon:yes stop_codon:yes gene_type:complete
MNKKDLTMICLASGLFMPFISLLSPKFLSLQGVGPCWSVLWLLPWVLNKGRIFGLFAGLCLGFLFDSISISSASQVPALMILGFWWGNEEGNNFQIDLSLNLGLMAFIGAIIYGLSLWIQITFIQALNATNWFHGWAFHTLLAQSILTGLLAPMICSWVILIRRSTK